MNFPIPISGFSALDYFATLLDQEGERETRFLCEAALYLCQIEYPKLNLTRILEDIDELHEKAKLHLRLNGATLTQTFETINHVLYRDGGFGVHKRPLTRPEDYYLHQTILERRGSPETLGILWLEMAQNLDFDAQAIVLPNQFWIRVLLPAGQTILDPGTGQVLSRATLLSHVTPFLPAERASPEALQDETDDALATYLPAATARETLAHLIEKLKTQYQSQEKPKWSHVEGALDRLLLLVPEQANYWKERADLRLQRGDTEAAQADMTRYHQLQANPLART